MRVALADAIKDFGALAELAADGPLTIIENGTPSLVVVPAEEYDRLRRQDRRVVSSGDLTEAELAAIESEEMSSEHGHLDAELGTGCPRVGRAVDLQVTFSRRVSMTI